MPTSTTAVTAPRTAPPAATGSAPAGSLDKDGFLRVLAAQLSKQDPMAPDGGTDMMAQMVQMSILEQLTNLATSQRQTAAEAEVTKQLALLGRTVSYRDADGATVTGIVEHVSLADDRTTLTIGGVAGIAPDAVLEVS